MNQFLRILVLLSVRCYLCVRIILYDIEIIILKIIVHFISKIEKGDEINDI